MKTTALLILIFFLQINISLWAQKDSTKFFDNTFVTASYGRGFLIAHRASLETLVNDYTNSIRLEFGKNTFGQKDWQSLYRFPSLGIGGFHGSVGNNEQLGKATAIYGFISAPYGAGKRRISFGYKFAIGLAYLSNHFDLYDNIYNIAIGSSINVYIHLDFDIKIKLYKERLYFKTGLGMTHFSNGKTQSPNLGLNIMDWHFTTGYNIGKQSKKIYTEYPKRDRHTFVAIVAGGAKEYNEPNLGKFFAGNVTLEYEYSVMKKSSWGAGLDYFYDGVLYDSYKTKDDPDAFKYASRFGIHIGYMFNYYRVGLIVQMGSYINPYYDGNGYLYHRIGIRAKVSQHLIANLSLKTHWAKADIVEFGLGYYFTR
jgi:hypothetical protein